MSGILRLASIFGVLIIYFQNDYTLAEAKSGQLQGYQEKIGIPIVANTQTSNFIVKYYIKGNNLFGECLLKDVSFRQDHGKKKLGKLLVFLDGRKTLETQSPLFIMKNLPSGSHRLTIEVVNASNQRNLFKQELTITIPK
jgi:hypothetical protein